MFRSLGKGECFGFLPLMLKENMVGDAGIEPATPPV
jgi:hypothetical protein